MSGIKITGSGTHGVHPVSVTTHPRPGGTKPIYHEVEGSALSASNSLSPGRAHSTPLADTPLSSSGTSETLTGISTVGCTSLFKSLAAGGVSLVGSPPIISSPTPLILGATEFSPGPLVTLAVLG